MTHQDAIQQQNVERYLLGELSGDARDRFEEHLFDCLECAADLKQGVLFLEAARPELRRTAVPVAAKPRPGLAWLTQAWALGPALAACMAFIVYQSAVVVPRLQTELAELQVPAVVASPLVLANAGARGGSVAAIVAPRHGFYQLSVDIPLAAGAKGYRCSLYSPTGALLWHVDVSAQQARDAVTIQVPASTAQEGLNKLRVQSIFPSSGNEDKDDKLGNLAEYRYNLSIAK